MTSEATATPPAAPPAHPPGNEQATSTNTSATATAAANAYDDSSDETIRLKNAYPGATNTINSIHQRKWYLSLDRSLSGFTPIPTPTSVTHHAKTYWVPAAQAAHEVGKRSKDTASTAAAAAQAQGAKGFERFHVLGREHERSLVTGRLAGDILADEGVQGYVPRGRWRAVVE